MIRFTLIGAGLMMLIVGALHLVAPQMMMEAPGIALTSANHFHIVRAAYGGAYLGIGTLFMVGALQPAHRRTALLAVAILFFGFAFGRIVSIVADGVPAPLYLGVLAAELFFATLAVASLRSTR